MIYNKKVELMELKEKSKKILTISKAFLGKLRHEYILNMK